MREAFEAVAEFLARHGGFDEYDAIVESMKQFGWALDQNHPARWRALFSALHEELSDARKAIDYTFVFDRLAQLTTRVPSDHGSEFFASKLAFHVIVARFQAAFEGYDADVFKNEKDVLLHTENVYVMCKRIDEIVNPKKPASALRKLLQEIKRVFDQEDPKAAWDTLYGRHSIPEVVLRRDLKRALRRLEDDVLGETLVEKSFPTLTASPSDKRIVISRRILESKYTGSSSDWRDLGSVVSVKNLSVERPVENRRESVGHAQPGMAEVVGETPPTGEQDNRVWSARLPIATPGGDSDPQSDGENNAMDNVVRQDNSARETPGQAQQRRRQPSPERAPAPSTNRQVSRTDRPQLAQPQAPVRAEAAEEIDDDGPGDDDMTDQARDAAANPRRRRGRKLWTPAEVEALVSGVKRFGGQWSLIKRTYANALQNRSGVDLKDKYRNLVKAKRIPPIQYAEDDE